MKTSSKYNKSEIMKEAWSNFKLYEKEISFGECLKMAWSNAKDEVNGISIFSGCSVKDLHNYLVNGISRNFGNGGYSLSYEAEKILKTVSEKSTGYQADIATKSLKSMRISEKQAWCIAYEYKKVA